MSSSGAEEAEFSSGLQALLADICASPRPDRDHRCEATYRRKLQTFTASAYFAKPIEVSPIVCALTGWEVAPGQHQQRNYDLLQECSSVLLQCCDCKAVLAVLIPPGLSFSSTKKLAAHYQKQLWDAHSVACIHRKEAEHFVCTALSNLQKKNTESPSMVLPSLMARVLPASSAPLELLENSAPWPTFRNRVEELLSHVQLIGRNHEIVAPDDYTQILDRVVEMLLQEQGRNHGGGDDDDNNLPTMQLRPELKTATTAAAALVLTGWDLKRQDGEPEGEGLATTSTAAVECSFCLSCQPLLATSPVSQEEPQRKKRRHVSTKWNHPVDAHRYYCPWICGMPSAAASTIAAEATPFWRLLADNLLCDRQVETEQNSGTSETLPGTEIHKLLKAGVSSRRINPSKTTIK